MRDEFGFDLLAHVRASFVNHLQIIREAHDAASEVLNRLPEPYTKVSRAGSAPLSQDDLEVEFHLEEMERLRAEDQRRAFGHAWLMYLVSIIEMELKAVKALFDDTAPFSKGRRNTGKRGRRTTRGQGMEKWSDKYLERFGIDLTAYAGYKFLDELLIARNCAVHEGGMASGLEQHYPDSAYIEYVGSGMREVPRLTFTDADFGKALKELHGFDRWLVARLREYERSQQSATR
jgi:hypothetical protein